MSLMLGEEKSFSLTANVTSPGYQRVILRGYLVSKRNDETWVAPLIPQLFYGAQGQQLTTWRQDIPSAGSQVILSRKAGGYPEVPREELYWRKIAEPPVEKEEVVEKLVAPSLFEWWQSIPTWQKALMVLGTITAVAGTIYLIKK